MEPEEAEPMREARFPNGQRSGVSFLATGFLLPSLSVETLQK
jgi:hypothetical protein